MRLAPVGFLILACALLAPSAPSAPSAPPEQSDRVTLEGQRQMLENPGTPVVGSRRAAVTVVEYFDYNCPYCKKLAPALEMLIAQDPNVALIYKDWPILSPISKYAASSALAAGWQGKYLQAHAALLRAPRLTKYDQVDAILEAAGVNLALLKQDRGAHAAQIEALLNRNETEAQALGINGTPGLVVGQQIVHGIVDLPQLKALIAQARETR